jgi:hypothetical protein
MNSTINTLNSNKVQWCWLPINSLQGMTNYPQLPAPQTWVRLLDEVSEFCYDEALLLCQNSDSEWVAWIPDHGQAILHIHQFCLMG